MKLPFRRPLLEIAALMLLVFPTLSHSAESQHVKASLLPETSTIAPGQTLWVALKMEMQPGWHIYWKNPGDSGTPVKIDWTLPAGFTAGEIQWPNPAVISVPPVYTYGYEKEALLLVPITAPATLKPGNSIDLGARIRWLECQVECIPAEAKLTLRLPASNSPATPDSAASRLFTKARENLPLDNAGWTFSASQNRESVRLTATPPAFLKGSIPSAHFFPGDLDLFKYDAPQTWTPSNGAYVIDLARSDLSTEPVKALRGVLVSEAGWRGAGSEKGLSVDVAVAGETKTAAESRPLIGVLFLAFVGGLILNLMPCVFPVLSIKVLGLVQQAGMTSSIRLKHGLAYTAGVLVTFWTLSGALLLLRAGGKQLGWGFQLQSPAIVIGLASLLFLLALNLFGVFEIGASLTQLAGAQKKEGYGGSFGSGLLATLVATPCTAPFMGSALGFALTQPAIASLAVFTSLALGMAAPYVLLTSSPALLRWVPRPGAWMESMKQGLSFIMAASVVWLLWVLGRQAGADAVVAACAGFVFIAIGAWIYGRWSTIDKAKSVQIVALALALGFVGGGIVVALKGSHGSPAENASASGPFASEPYSLERVSELRAAGRPVFVDFTAAWCLTCQVNERVALNTPQVAAKIKEKNVAVLRGDWTSRDPKITEALQAIGRSGVPAYVLYPANSAAAPVVLPEILTPAIVVSALDALN